MRKPKGFSVFLLACIMAFAMSSSSFADVDDTGFSDVAADAWCANAAVYCHDNGLMSGTASTTFAPNATMTRAMLATVLYRMAGSPAVTAPDNFTDTVEGSWYADAVAWASASGIISGYGNGLFGTDDPVTRQQMAAILWRYEGSPTAQAEGFTDENSISAYAAPAVDWARANGIIGGLDDGRFDPNGNATRAQVATILMNYTHSKRPAPTPEPPAAPLRVALTYGIHTITFELNDSQAARDLYDQLPLTVAVEDYGTNEKIFYPPDRLDAAGAPLASGGAGTLAYYAPWGDVVLFYDSFSANSQLYGLGMATEGAEWIEALSGTVTFQKSSGESK